MLIKVKLSTYINIRKLDFTTRNINRNKGYYKSVISEGKVIVINVCKPNNKASNYIKQAQLRGEINNYQRVTANLAQKEISGANGTILYCNYSGAYMIACICPNCYARDFCQKEGKTSAMRKMQ